MQRSCWENQTLWGRGFLWRHWAQFKRNLQRNVTITSADNIAIYVGWICKFYQKITTFSGLITQTLTLADNILYSLFEGWEENILTWDEELTESILQPALTTYCLTGQDTPAPATWEHISSNMVTIQVQVQVISPGTLSSTDPTSYLEDRVILPDVQFSSNFHSWLK